MELPVCKLVRYRRDSKFEFQTSFILSGVILSSSDSDKRVFLLLVVGNILAYMNRFAINYALLGMTSKSSDAVTNGTCFNSTGPSITGKLE